MNDKNSTTTPEVQNDFTPLSESTETRNELIENAKDKTKEAASGKTIFSSIFSAVKNKLNFKSIFDDSIPRTSNEKKISSKYLILLICTFLLIIFWSSNTMNLTMPMPIEEDTIEISAPLSMNQLCSAISTMSDVIEKGDELFNISSENSVKGVMIFLDIAVLILGCAGFCIFITPIFALFPLLQRSTSKRLWVTLEKICLITSFIIQCLFYLVFYILIEFLNSEISEYSSSPFSLTPNFASFLLIAVYVTAFVCTIKISHSIPRRYVCISPSADGENA